MPVVGLPSALEGYRIAHLTDLHLGGLGALHDRLVADLDARAPRLVAITGDAVESREALPALSGLCARLARPGRAVVASLGNWEHWARLEPGRLRDLYAGHGARLLVNASAAIEDGLAVAATDDLVGGEPQLERACRELPAGGVRILLTHSPALADLPAASGQRFDLVLAGHTHGGQVRLPGPVRFRPRGSGRFCDGFYDTPLGRMYVSRGLGTSILPVRFACRPELAFFTLVPG